MSAPCQISWHCTKPSLFVSYWHLSAKFHDNVQVGQSWSRHGITLVSVPYFITIAGASINKGNAFPEVHLLDFHSFWFVSELRSTWKCLGHFLVHIQCSRTWWTIYKLSKTELSSVYIYVNTQQCGIQWMSLAILLVKVGLVLNIEEFCHLISHQLMNELMPSVNEEVYVEN